MMSFIEDQNLSEYISIRPPELATDDSIISDVIIEWDIARKENDTLCFARTYVRL